MQQTEIITADIITDLWIQYLDRDYIEQKKKITTNNKDYFYFPKTKIELNTKGLYIIFKKYEKKTQFIIQDEYSRNLYLSDIDIINIIINSKEHIYNILSEVLFRFISNPIFSKEIFNINGENFNYYKIIDQNIGEHKFMPLEEGTFLTETDFNLKYIDFVTLIGLIINKEYIFNPDPNNSRHIRQAKKYYILSKAFREGQYIKELTKKGIDCSKGLEYIYRKKGSAVSIDPIFEDFTLQKL